MEKFKQDMAAINKEVDRLIQDRKVLIDACLFYATPELAKPEGCWQQDYPAGISYKENGETILDFGQIAREALAEVFKK